MSKEPEQWTAAPSAFCELCQEIICDDDCPNQKTRDAEYWAGISWTQAICERCYILRFADQGSIRTPVIVKGFPLERCCYCTKDTIWGCYIREDPCSPLIMCYRSKEGTSG